MTSVFISLLLTLRGFARSRAALDLEVLALHHQLKMLQRSQTRRLRLVQADRGSGRGWRARGTAGKWRSSSSTGNRHRLASSRLPLVLDMEKPPTPRLTDGPGRPPRIDSDHVADP